MSSIALVPSPHSFKRRPPFDLQSIIHAIVDIVEPLAKGFPVLHDTHVQRRLATPRYESFVADSAEFARQYVT